MCPELELLSVHPKLTPGDFPHLFVDAAQFELSHLKAHGCTAVAATAGLVKHDGAVGFLQLLDQLAGRVGYADAARTHGDDVVHRPSLPALAV
jgi:hypothetical protein